MTSKAETVAEYVAQVDESRRPAIQAVLDLVRANLPAGYEERMNYGMIGWVVPHSIYPPGYHCDRKQPLPFMGLAAQKNYMSLYVTAAYRDDLREEFETAYLATGKKLDMGRSCIRFKKLDDLALDVIAEHIQKLPVDMFIENYEKSLGSQKS